MELKELIGAQRQQLNEIELGILRKHGQVSGLQIKGERILTDQQLIELHNDIRDGETMLVSIEYHNKFDATLRKLIAQITKSGMWNATTLAEVVRLLGPEPKEPPKET